MAGCVAEADLSLRMGNKDLDQTKIDRITACFASYGLPTHVPVRAILTELFWLLDADDALAVLARHSVTHTELLGTEC